MSSRSSRSLDGLAPIDRIPYDKYGEGEGPRARLLWSKSFNTIRDNEADPVVEALVSGNSDLRETGEFADFTIVCGDKEYKVHRTILASRSVYFMKAFVSEFKEKETSRINLEGYSVEVIEALLEYFYKLEFKVPPDFARWEGESQRSGSSSSSVSPTVIHPPHPLPARPAMIPPPPWGAQLPPPPPGPIPNILPPVAGPPPGPNAVQAMVPPPPPPGLPPGQFVQHMVGPPPPGVPMPGLPGLPGLPIITIPRDLRSRNEAPLDRDAKAKADRSERSNASYSLEAYLNFLVDVYFAADQYRVQGLGYLVCDKIDTALLHNLYDLSPQITVNLLQKVYSVELEDQNRIRSLLANHILQCDLQALLYDEEVESTFKDNPEILIDVLKALAKDVKPDSVTCNNTRRGSRKITLAKAIMRQGCTGSCGNWSNNAKHEQEVIVRSFYPGVRAFRDKGEYKLQTRESDGGSSYLA